MKKLFNYQTLIKLFPVGLALNVFSNAFINTSKMELHVHIAFFVIFSVITFDYIVEYSKYDIDDLPHNLSIIIFLIGVVIFILVISISFFSNNNLKNCSIPIVILLLAIYSFLEFLYILLYGRYNLSKDNEKRDILFDEKDIKIYCLWEIIFFVFYLFLLLFSLIDINKLLANSSPVNADEIAIWIALVFLIIEIFVYNKYLSYRSKIVKR